MTDGIINRQVLFASQNINVTERTLINPGTGRVEVFVYAQWETEPVTTVEINLEPIKGPYVYDNNAHVTVSPDFYKRHKTSITREVVNKLVSDYLDNYMPMFFKKDKSKQTQENQPCSDSTS